MNARATHGTPRCARALLPGTLLSLLLSAGAPAQIKPPTTTLPAPPPIQPSAGTVQALQDATAPVFTQAPTGTIPLRGRAPGGQVLFETNGGERPLRYELTVQPTTYTQYFSVTGVRTGAPPAGPNQTGTAIESTFGPRLMALRFAGLPATQPLPANIEVYVRVTDARDRRTEKLFSVRPTNSGAAPVISSINVNHNRFFSSVYLSTSGFSFDEEGSRIELRYKKTGLRYRCAREDDCASGSSSGVSIRVPRLQDQGRDVEIRLVNDTASSPYRSIQLAEGLRDVQWLERVTGSMLSLSAEFRGSNPEKLSGSRDECDEEYAVWRSISTPFAVFTDPRGRPASVSIKSKPANGSRMESSEPIVYNWSGAAVDVVNFSVQITYHTYLGRCAERVIGG